MSEKKRKGVEGCERGSRKKRKEEVKEEKICVFFFQEKKAYQVLEGYLRSSRLFFLLRLRRD